MGFLLYCLAILSVLSWVTVLGNEDNSEKPCDLHDVTNPSPDCSKNETCTAKPGASVGYCNCKPGYSRKINPGICLLLPVSTTFAPIIAVTTPSPERLDVMSHKSVSTSAITAAVLVPLLLAGVVLLVLVGRRYKCFERLQILQGRHYEEVRIGQEDDDDDPPLA